MLIGKYMTVATRAADDIVNDDWISGVEFLFSSDMMDAIASWVRDPCLVESNDEMAGALCSDIIAVSFIIFF